MVRILSIILFVSWFGYGALVLSGASNRTTYLTMSFLYITIGVLFLVGLPVLLREFQFFQEKTLDEFPPGPWRRVAEIIFGEVGVKRSRIEWICIIAFGGIVFLWIGVALFFLATDKMAYFKYLIEPFR
jgi:hypothetical protein